MVNSVRVMRHVRWLLVKVLSLFVVLSFLAAVVIIGGGCGSSVSGSGITYSNDRFHYQTANNDDFNDDIPRRHNKYYERHLQEGNDPLIIQDTVKSWEVIHDMYGSSSSSSAITAIYHACHNLRDDCDMYANNDGCRTDPLFMYHHCPVSCHVCPTNHDEGGTNNIENYHMDGTYNILQRNIPIHETFGVQEFNPYRMDVPINGMFIIPRDGGSGPSSTGSTLPPPPQRIPSSAPSQERLRLEQKVRDVQKYLLEVVDVEDQYRLVRDMCRSVINHTDCAIWSIPSILHENLNNSSTTSDNNHMNDTTTAARLIDRCETDWDFMKHHGCHAFCYKCEYLHIESVCPIDPNEKNTLYPGDVHTLFTTIVDEFSDVYNITILSRPATTENEDIDNDDESDRENTSIIQTQQPDGPWIVQLDDFVTVEEAQVLIALGTEKGYTRSIQVGELDDFGKNFDTISNHRTSSNTWCDTDDCIEHEVTQRVWDRIYNLTNGIDYDHGESIQLLQYQPGQYYHTHHDYIVHEIHRQQGVRILTLFIYLNNMQFHDPENDEEEDGYDYNTFTPEQHRSNGGTNFPHLNITVLPHIGRAVLWTNVLDDHPNYMDDRTEHEALMVTYGMKYGANVWFHQRSYTCEEDE